MGGKYVYWCVCVCACACMCMYLLYAYKHYQRHQDQAACAIDTHIVGHRLTVAFFKHCCCWNNVSLAVWRQQEQSERVIITVQQK